tara:strand:- start:28 stop:864 length:837 start_codon:yes stop_codon:yes gene_type:complete
MKIGKRIGFMQGRLSPMVGNKIQAFPSKNWSKEFKIAKSIRIGLMEWTIDQKKLYKNPLLTERGRNKIQLLCKKFNIRIESLTGDCFMQSPFWKFKKYKRQKLQKDFLNIIQASSQVGIKKIVVPLVDNGSLQNLSQQKIIIKFMKNVTKILKKNKQMILFELDMEPKKANNFINKVDSKYFGINYDIGNSASLGFDPKKEFISYGKRIKNIHIKDRVYRGNSVKLGYGNANFEKVFSLLTKIKYKGNYILQTARAKNNKDHVAEIEESLKKVKKWIQ